MILIKSKAKLFEQGALGGLAKSEESPVMSNGFSSDFWMDSVEVTQSFYQSVMARNAVPASSAYGYGSDFPVYGVTWYDAILFCNARSRKWGLDTVYEFTGISRNLSGSAYGVTGLSIHLERKGFRLPTEAEWEFAAKAGASDPFPWGGLNDSAQAGVYAWHAGNSGGITHAVATRKPNFFGLYDMAGNVMEWVNDWKGPYSKEGFSDFAGARDPGAQFEKPVKGGAFKYGFPELRPANRSATYAAIPSSASEYVGFRCVLGAIPNPQYLSPEGGLAGTDPFTIRMTRLKGNLSGRAAKLVFINIAPGRRQLAYIDFRSSPPVAHEFTDFDKVFHPAISPDGNWVAFGTGLEGSEEGSEIFVRRLDGSSAGSAKIADGYIPRWWVDAAKQDTFLVYSTTAVDNENERWNRTKTLLLRISGGAAVGEPAALTEDGGFHDGLSKGKRYLATGYRRLKVRDLSVGGTRTLFIAPGNGKSEGDTSQVCNVSMSPDSSGNLLFLDFGFAGVSHLTGTAYGIHRFAFLSDPAGKVSRWFRAPEGEEAWADLEWSNHPGYAVAAATDPSGDQKNLYLLELGDSAYTPLATGTNLIQPGLWIGNGEDFLRPEGLDYDSLGLYDEPASFEGQSILAVKMHAFWKYFRDTEGFFLGSSQMADGFDPNQITTVKSLNMAFGGGDFASVEMLIRNYVLPHGQRAKIVGIGVPLGWMRLPKGNLTWNQIYPGNKGFRYDSSHAFWRGGLPLNFGKILAGIPYPDRPGMDSLGLYRFPSRGWGPAILPETPGIEWDITDPEFRKNLRTLEDIVIALSARKIHCLYMTFPQSPGYTGMQSYSVHGPSWTTARAMLGEMQALAERYPYFHVLDLNKGGNHGFSESDAFDEVHLSETGAAKLSRELDPVIRTILSK